MIRPSFFVIIEDSPFTSCKKESPNHWAFFLLSVFHWRVNLFHQGPVEQAGAVQHRLDLLLTEALLQQHEDSMPHTTRYRCPQNRFHAKCVRRSNCTPQCPFRRRMDKPPPLLHGMLLPGGPRLRTGYIFRVPFFFLLLYDSLLLTKQSAKAISTVTAKASIVLMVFFVKVGTAESYPWDHLLFLLFVEMIYF